jgi:hypothetical protein
MATKRVKVVKVVKPIKSRVGNRLNALRVSAIKEPGMHADGLGLWLQVTVPPGGDPASPRRSWIFRFTLRGVSREMGLGRFPDVSLSDARELAEACRKLTRDRLDPIEVRAKAREDAAQELANRRQAEKTAPTFEWCMVDIPEAQEVVAQLARAVGRADHVGAGRQDHS